MGVRVGIYTSEYEWGQVHLSLSLSLSPSLSLSLYYSYVTERQVTNNDSTFGNYPLWYPSWPTPPNFDDFVPFGGERLSATEE
jgi:hypothetical protein